MKLNKGDLILIDKEGIEALGVFVGIGKLFGYKYWLYYKVDGVDEAGLDLCAFWEYKDYKHLNGALEDWFKIIERGNTVFK